MKTYRQLYPQVFAFDNLLAAFYQARRGKPKTPELCAFEYYLEENLLALREELRTHTYRPGPCHHFYIHEPKTRKVSAAPFRDRVVHHALCSVIEPIFESRFIYDSYANRKGKGAHRALARCQEFLRHNEYVFHGDIQKFFPSIDHQILLGILGRHHLRIETNAGDAFRILRPPISIATELRMREEVKAIIEERGD